MRLILFLPFLYLIPNLVSGQNLEDFVLTKTHEKGTLYHIKEIELDASCKKTDFTIDFTYLKTQDEDSVRALMTLKSRSIKGKPNAISFSFSESEINWDEEKIGLLYVSKKKKDWETRIEISLTEDEFIQLLNAGNLEINWRSVDFECEASLPKKYRESYQIFAELLRYNE